MPESFFEIVVPKRDYRHIKLQLLCDNMTSYSAKFDDVARGNSVRLTEFAQGGDYSTVAEIAEVAHEEGSIDTMNQKVELPQDYVDSKLEFGIKDVVSAATGVVEGASRAATLNYSGRKSNAAERETDRLDPRTNSDDLKQVREMLSASDTKRKLGNAGVVGGLSAAVAGYQVGSIHLTGGGSVFAYASAGLSAAGSEQKDVYQQEAGKGWEHSYGHFDVELV